MAHFLPNAAPETISVKVADQAGNPANNVLVTMTMPTDGPTASFTNGSRVDVAVTDKTGVATFRGVLANNVAGEFVVNVTAKGVEGAFPGLSGSTEIRQKNIVGNIGAMLRQADHADRHSWTEWSGRKKFLVFGGVAAGVGLAVMFGTRQGASGAPGGNGGWGVKPGDGVVTGGQ